MIQDDATNLVPWLTRTKTPDAVRNLPKPTAEPEVSDARSAEYNIWALEQAELARQRELEAQIDPSLTPDEIKALYEAELVKENAHALEERQANNGRQFRSECPAFIPTPANADRMAKYMEARGFDGSSPDHFWQAFSELKAAGKMKTNPAPMPTPRQSYTEADLYSMDINELRELAEHDENFTKTRLVGTRRAR
jgi:hypothetical protein